MNFSLAQKSRILWLRFCTVTFAATLIYIFVKPQQDIFKDMPVFQTWESINTDKFKELNGNDKIYGKRFREIQNHNLAIDVLLLPTFNNSNLKLIELYLGYRLKPKDLTLIKQKNLGFYGLFTKNNSTYLSTCIHPQGKITFEQKQQTELANSNLQSRIIPWILGLSDLRDWRCFWINMSVDLDNITEKEAINLLQKKMSAIISKNKLQ